MSLPYSNSEKIIDAEASTKTSGGWDISKRQQATIQFTCNSYSSGSGTFTIDVSNDGTNWITGIAFLDSKQTDVSTFVVSKVLSSAISEGAIIVTGWKLIRVVCTISGTGTYSAVLQNAG